MVPCEEQRETDKATGEGANLMPAGLLAEEDIEFIKVAPFLHYWDVSQFGVMATVLNWTWEIQIRVSARSWNLRGDFEAIPLSYLLHRVRQMRRRAVYSA